ncbi:hypothetical protein [Flavicella sp.]|uniref:hypothetical protein n=1 Tax=Flavicella sp. TaxID=2957742 RepID=UPI002621A20C|nr:hypothetical protein [Flavicella sp.]MDG1805505.1 hypothetical protein [Flavicella sp.]
MINKIKLFIAPISEEIVVRKVLINRLNANSDKSVISLTAPMGYGKSTLISSWIQFKKHPYFWYSLDEFDNNLIQFLNYFKQIIPAENKEFHYNIDLLLTSKNKPDIQKYISLFSNALLVSKHTFCIFPKSQLWKQISKRSKQKMLWL